MDGINNFIAESLTSLGTLQFNTLIVRCTNFYMHSGEMMHCRFALNGSNKVLLNFIVFTELQTESIDNTLSHVNQMHNGVLMPDENVPRLLGVNWQVSGTNNVNYLVQRYAMMSANGAYDMSHIRHFTLQIITHQGDRQKKRVHTGICSPKLCTVYLCFFRMNGD